MLRIPLAFVAPLALGLGACTSTHQGVVNRFSGGEGQRDVTEVRDNGVLVVQFDLVNTRQGPVAFQWTIDWFDKAGLKLDYVPQSWTPERLPGGSSKTIKRVAPHPDATSWQLQTGSRDEVQ